MKIRMYFVTNSNSVSYIETMHPEMTEFRKRDEEKYWRHKNAGKNAQEKHIAEGNAIISTILHCAIKTKRLTKSN